MRRNSGIIGTEVLSTITGTSGKYDTFDQYNERLEDDWPRIQVASITASSYTVYRLDTQTINVITEGIADGTTLYWTVDTASQLSVNSGTFVINNNSGSFTITPDIKTSFTVGSLDAVDITLQVRTVSTSGTIIGTSPSFNIPAVFANVGSGSVDEGSYTSIGFSIFGIGGNGSGYSYIITNGVNSKISKSFGSSYGLTFVGDTSLRQASTGNISAYQNHLTTGNETLLLTLKYGSYTLGTGNLIINDTSTSTITITQSGSTSEGGTGNFVVSGINFTANNNLYRNFPASLEYQSATSADVSLTSNTNLNVPGTDQTNYSYNIGYSIANDTINEIGNRFRLKLTNSWGNVVAYSDYVDIIDTSPVISSLYISTTNTNEGLQLQCYISSGTNIEGKTFGWEIAHGNTTSADFILTSGSFTGQNSFYITILSDELYEGGTENFSIRILYLGTGIYISTAIYINDTSITRITSTSLSGDNVPEATDRYKALVITGEGLDGKTIDFTVTGDGASDLVFNDFGDYVSGLVLYNTISQAGFFQAGSDDTVVLYLGVPEDDTTDGQKSFSITFYYDNVYIGQNLNLYTTPTYTIEDLSQTPVVKGFNIQTIDATAGNFYYTGRFHNLQDSQWGPSLYGAFDPSNYGGSQVIQFIGTKYNNSNSGNYPNNIGIYLANPSYNSSNYILALDSKSPTTAYFSGNGQKIAETNNSACKCYSNDGMYYYEWLGDYLTGWACSSAWEDYPSGGMLFSSYLAISSSISGMPAMRIAHDGSCVIFAVPTILNIVYEVCYFSTPFTQLGSSSTTTFTNGLRGVGSDPSTPSISSYYGGIPYEVRSRYSCFELNEDGTEITIIEGQVGSSSQVSRLLTFQLTSPYDFTNFATATYLSSKAFTVTNFQDVSSAFPLISYFCFDRISKDRVYALIQDGDNSGIAVYNMTPPPSGGGGGGGGTDGTGPTPQPAYDLSQAQFAYDSYSSTVGTFHGNFEYGYQFGFSDVTSNPTHRYILSGSIAIIDTGSNLTFNYYSSINAPDFTNLSLSRYADYYNGSYNMWARGSTTLGYSMGLSNGVNGRSFEIDTAAGEIRAVDTWDFNPAMRTMQEGYWQQYETNWSSSIQYGHYINGWNDYSSSVGFKYIDRTNFNDPFSLNQYNNYGGGIIYRIRYDGNIGQGKIEQLDTQDGYPAGPYSFDNQTPQTALILTSGQNIGFFEFNTDGTKVYFFLSYDGSSQKLCSYTLSSPWEIQSIQGYPSSPAEVFDVTNALIAQNFNPAFIRGMALKKDGGKDKMYIMWVEYGSWQNNYQDMFHCSVFSLPEEAVNLYSNQRSANELYVSPVSMEYYNDNSTLDITFVGPNAAEKFANTLKTFLTADKGFGIVINANYNYLFCDFDSATNLGTNVNALIQAVTVSNDTVTISYSNIFLYAYGGSDYTEMVYNRVIFRFYDSTTPISFLDNTVAIDLGGATASILSELQTIGVGYTDLEYREESNGPPATAWVQDNQSLCGDWSSFGNLLALSADSNLYDGASSYGGEMAQFSLIMEVVGTSTPVEPVALVYISFKDYFNSVSDNNGNLNINFFNSVGAQGFYDVLSSYYSAQWALDDVNLYMQNNYAKYYIVIRWVDNPSYLPYVNGTTVVIPANDSIYYQSGGSYYSSNSNYGSMVENGIYLNMSSNWLYYGDFTTFSHSPTNMIVPFQSYSKIELIGTFNDSIIAAYVDADGQLYVVDPVNTATGSFNDKAAIFNGTGSISYNNEGNSAFYMKLGFPVAGSYEEVPIYLATSGSAYYIDPNDYSIRFYFGSSGSMYDFDAYLGTLGDSDTIKFIDQYGTQHEIFFIYGLQNYSITDLLGEKRITWNAYSPLWSSQTITNTISADYTYNQLSAVIKLQFVIASSGPPNFLYMNYDGNSSYLPLFFESEADASAAEQFFNNAPGAYFRVDGSNNYYGGSSIFDFQFIYINSGTQQWGPNEWRIELYVSYAYFSTSGGSNPYGSGTIEQL